MNYDNRLYIPIEIWFYADRVLAANKIYYFWKRILAKRQLFRLRLGNEIDVHPKIGQRYKSAMDNFSFLSALK